MYQFPSKTLHGGTFGNFKYNNKLSVQGNTVFIIPCGYQQLNTIYRLPSFVWSVNASEHRY